MKIFCVLLQHCSCSKTRSRGDGRRWQHRQQWNTDKLPLWRWSGYSWFALSLCAQNWCINFSHSWKFYPGFKMGRHIWNVKQNSHSADDSSVSCPNTVQARNIVESSVTPPHIARFRYDLYCVGGTLSLTQSINQGWQTQWLRESSCNREREAVDMWRE